MRSPITTIINIIQTNYKRSPTHPTAVTRSAVLRVLLMEFLPTRASSEELDIRKEMDTHRSGVRADRPQPTNLELERRCIYTSASADPFTIRDTHLTPTRKRHMRK